MKIIHRYILREFFESFLFGLIIFSCILMLDQIFQLINLLLSKGVSLWLVAKLFFLIIPNIFSLTIPMAVLFGILLSYGRLSEDNEITSFRSAGISYTTFTFPVIAISLIFSIFLIYFNQNLSPKTHHSFRELYKDILNQKPLIKFEENSLTNIGEYKIYVDKVKKDYLKGINIYKFSQAEKGVPWRISASSGTLAVNKDCVIFLLYNGFWQKIDPQKPDTLVHLDFSSYKFSISLEGQTIPFSQSLREMTSKELKQEIRKYKEKQMPTNFLETEYWVRWTLAFAPLVFAVIGIPLGIVLERGGRAIGFGISLLIFFGYYMLLVLGLNTAEKGYFQPKFILFLPNVIVFILGLFLWRRMVKK